VWIRVVGFGFQLGRGGGNGRDHTASSWLISAEGKRRLVESGAAAIEAAH